MKSLLSDNFFSVLNSAKNPEDSSRIRYRISLNPLHEIYSGHFPGNPVAPGVCLIQMIRELVSLHLGSECMMQKVDEAKFMNIVNPNATPELDVDIQFRDSEPPAVQASAVLSESGQVYLKFRGRFKPA